MVDFQSVPLSFIQVLSFLTVQNLLTLHNRLEREGHSTILNRQKVYLNYVSIIGQG